MNRVNILEVTNLKDLRTVMESNVTVVLGLTCSETSGKAKVMIRKFLKRKSEKFPLVTFVYMEVSDNDRNNGTLNILKGNSYPKVYHIRNSNQLLVRVEEADYEGIYESFAKVEQYYVAEMKEFQQRMQNQNNETDDEATGDEDEISEDDQDKVIETDQGKKKKTKGKQKTKSGTMDSAQQNQSMNNGSQDMGTTVNPVLEKKKNLEKLVYLNNQYDNMKIDLIKEIKRRKKLEAFQKEKKKKSSSDDDEKSKSKERKRRRRNR